MRKSLLIFIAGALTSTTLAQSGRRVVTPPPRPEPTSEPPRASQPDRVPIGPRDLSFLPESVLNHRLQSLNNGSFRLADFAGSVVVLNLWATWCGPCRSEVPEYEQVRREYAGRGVEFIGLTAEDPRTSADRVKRFAREFKFGFRLGWADHEMARTLMNGRNVIPQTLVIAADGRIVKHWHGYSPGHSAERLRETIKIALGGGGSAER